MGFLTLHHLVEAVVVLVLARHVVGAAQIFSSVKGERPTPIGLLFALANFIVIHKAFGTPVILPLAIPGLLGFVCSLALFEWAFRTVRGKFFSLALSRDAPQFLLTLGPYTYIRNPFYTSYLLAYVGAAIMFPGLATLAVLGMMATTLVMTARFEERKFQRSALGAEYESYKRQTGMFIPRFSRRDGRNC